MSSSKIYQVDHIRNSRNVDTSAKRSGDVLRELRKQRADIQAIHKEQVELILNLNRVKDSPYLTDRPNYNPDKIQGTEKETAWKKVEVASPFDNTERTQKMNLKKLNVI